MKNAVNRTKVNFADGSFQREFSMDKTEYDHIVKMVEDGESVDFEIPKDAPEGKRLSGNALDGVGLDEQIPIDLNEMFNKK